MNTPDHHLPTILPRSRRAASTLAVLAAVSFAPLGACKSTATEAPKAPVTRVKVAAAVVGEGLAPRVLPLTGSLRGEQQSDLAAGAAGRLLKVSIERGTEVKKGDVIALIDTHLAQISAAEASASANLAKAQVVSAERECARYKALFDKGGVSAAEYDKLTDQCRTTSLSAKAAELRAAQAGANVADGAIRAPFAGVVADRWVDVGEFVRADSRVVTLVTMNPLRLEFAVPEVHMRLVKKGGKVSFSVPSQPGRAFQGEVRYLGAAIRETTRDLAVEAAVDNADRALAPGMFAEVSLALGETTTPFVPKSAVVERDGRAFLFVVEDGRAVERIVSLGAREETRTAVTAGVKKGEKVVAAPPAELSNGAYLDLDP
jgi:RND family efflux transporter MFP subunit